MDRLIVRVRESRGIDLSMYRKAYLERRLAARMRVVGVDTYRKYADLLEGDPSEYRRFLDVLTINVTEFYRDQAVWDVLSSQVIPDILASKKEGRSRTIRIWSAGCATGEEPYSLVMLLLDALGPQLSRVHLSVLATDLDQSALARAQAGVFSREKLSRIPPEYQLRFTRELNEEQFEIVPEVRGHVRFTRASLFDDAPARAVDLVLCRNVFIYFDREQQERVLENFGRAMARGGYVVLGRSERLSGTATALFEPINGKERVYRRRGLIAHESAARG
jgi:chemotaxis methyl-accepting protein methylase